METVNATNKIELSNHTDGRAPDPFEDLKALLGCAYISDLKFLPWNDQALRLISRMRLTRYSLHALSDLAHYLTGETEAFADYEQASQYFQGYALKQQPRIEVNAEFA